MILGYLVIASLSDLLSGTLKPAIISQLPRYLQRCATPQLLQHSTSQMQRSTNLPQGLQLGFSVFAAVFGNKLQPSNVAKLVFTKAEKIGLFKLTGCSGEKQQPRDHMQVTILHEIMILPLDIDRLVLAKCDVSMQMSIYYRSPEVTTNINDDSVGSTAQESSHNMAPQDILPRQVSVPKGQVGRVMTGNRCP